MDFMLDWNEIAAGQHHQDAIVDLLDRYGVVGERSRDDLLHQVAGIFVHLPYENLTKLLRKRSKPVARDRLRLPADVVSDHVAYGAGGTCFSLSCLFGLTLDRLGLTGYPVLARMRTTSALHTALVIPVDGRHFLVDPGYLIHMPVLLRPGATTRIRTNAASVEIVGRPDGRTYDLSTNGLWRYAFVDDPLDADRFVRLWIESFDWTMMHDLHLSRVFDGGYLYVNGHTLRRVVEGRKENRNIRQNRIEVLHEEFGLDSGLTRSALEAIRDERSDVIGGAR